MKDYTEARVEKTVEGLYTVSLINQSEVIVTIITFPTEDLALEYARFMGHTREEGASFPVAPVNEELAAELLSFKEELQSTQAHLLFLLENEVESEDGSYAFPDGEMRPCKKKAKKKSRTMAENPVGDEILMYKQEERRAEEPKPLASGQKGPVREAMEKAKREHDETMEQAAIPVTTDETEADV